MGLTYTPVADVRNQPQRYGQINIKVVDVTFDSSYPTGGEEVVEAQLGFAKVYGLIAIAMVGGAFGTVTSVDLDVSTPATPKLRAYTGAGVQVANAADLSTIIVRCVVYGK